MRVVGLSVACLVLAFGLGACGATTLSRSARGYGPPPEAPEALIAPLVSGAAITRLTTPEPYFLRLDGRWFYGWRVCARLAPEGRIGFFLIRHGRVALAAVGDGVGGPDGVRAQRFCAAALENAG